MTDRWFSEQELEQLSRPTMDRAIEAIDAGDLEQARRLCEEMKHEWQMLHDLMASGVLDLVSFIQQRLGDEGVAEAWSESMGRGWRRHHDAIVGARSPRARRRCSRRHGARTRPRASARTRAASRSPRTRRRSRSR